ncbi:MAG: hypothetical protein HYX72_06215 [Acidobacteria bacterium]|nr:hypothetical protein [Acidobacteriota bacterium]
MFVQNGQPIIQHNDTGELVSAADPARGGEIVPIWATGLDCIFPYPEDGVPAPTSRVSACNQRLPALFIDGKPTPRDTVIFAGRAPGLVGVDQVNVRLPYVREPGVISLTLVTGTQLVHPGNTVQIPIK